MPVPVRLTVWGLLVALSVNVSVPVVLPVAVGVKTTFTVQLAPTASELLQLSVSLNPLLATMLLIERAAVPELLRATACALLLVPTSWLVKTRLVGEIVASGCVKPVPVSVMV
jgi:hypothetical protein